METVAFMCDAQSANASGIEECAPKLVRSITATVDGETIGVVDVRVQQCPQH